MYKQQARSANICTKEVHGDVEVKAAHSTLLYYSRTQRLKLHYSDGQLQDPAALARNISSGYMLYKAWRVSKPGSKW
jgi:hypothetical protein